MSSLIPLYQQHLNLADATFCRIDHNDAMVAIVYKVTKPNGTELILKICSRTKDYLREAYFLNYFADILPVPRIVQLIEPATDIDGAILMECLPGALLKKANVSDEIGYEVGSLLARIHLNRMDGYGDLTDTDELKQNPEKYFTSKYDEGFDECSNNLPKSLLAECRSYYEAHLSLLGTVDGPCIIHRDFRPGNMIVSDGKLQGIIDWSSARSSFAEEDFCTLEHGEWKAHSSFKKSFLAGYKSIRKIPDYTAIMPLLRVCRALAAIGFIVKSGTWNSNQSRLYQSNRHFLETLFNSINTA